MIKSIQHQDTSLIFGENLNNSINTVLKENYADHKKIVITDDTVSDIWIEDFISSNEELHHAEIIVLPAGEDNKTIDICTQVWESLSDYKITRHDLIINFGGGVITDMGGFIASTFKRGLKFINIPTTLLAQVDASVGGKTGIDLGPFKNQIGAFANPDYVFIDYKYLNTLDQMQLTSGYAEMLKHGLIYDDKHWNHLVSIKSLSVNNISKYIHDSVNIKHQIVTADPFEKDSRKSLNFGHTIGHAIEGYLLIKDEGVPHGLAIAWGMSAEAHLAFQKKLICEDDLNFITGFIGSTYPKCDVSINAIPELLDLMVNDKKNEDSINFTLLKDIGTFIINQSATSTEIEIALRSILD